MNTEHFQMLFEYNYWANQRVWDSISRLSDEEYHRDLGFGHGSIHNQMVNLVAGEWIWLTRLHGESPRALLDPADYTRSSIQDVASTVELKFRRFVQDLDDTKLERHIQYRNTQGGSYSNMLWTVLVEVTNHSTAYRAQAMDMVQKLGGITKELYFIHWYRESMSTAR
jgi:uncharacterized damage-inducible protein DinB